ncbi:alpha/beta fold hydrolase [Nocardioides marmoriginsengisoli]|uniref:Alpha/beta fold hydrolase n=1 Tax=Nocardioides marmoriginsengisoli TaxID=661483 RepID=A0A3N0CLA8_9ACTN|nr:alpha/beta fold hydrolase [Nocardioides marmoriginsengisoli]RNL64222.1 alpha/beta fold hydrolase [Nocardioides marmoriginsengisoli]
MSLAPHAEPFYADGTPDASGRRVGVLLSHGFTGSPASVVPWGRHLAGLGYAVAVPRLPGHGTTWQEMAETRYDDYYAAIESEFEALKARCDVVVVGGLSMGGCLTLNLAERRAGEIAGLVMVNPAVASTNKQLLLLPVMKHLTKAFPAIGNDIKKDGVLEYAYPKTPLKPLASMLAAWKQVRADLAKVTAPVLLFRSADDHVVDPSSAAIILAGVSSTEATERVLTESYHVATLDNDAETIFTESADFIARVTAP